MSFTDLASVPAPAHRLAPPLPGRHHHRRVPPGSGLTGGQATGKLPGKLPGLFLFQAPAPGQTWPCPIRPGPAGLRARLGEWPMSGGLAAGPADHNRPVREEM